MKTIYTSTIGVFLFFIFLLQSNFASTCNTDLAVLGTDRPEWINGFLDRTATPGEKPSQRAERLRDAWKILVKTPVQNWNKAFRNRASEGKFSDIEVYAISFLAIDASRVTLQKLLDQAAAHFFPTETLATSAFSQFLDLALRELAEGRMVSASIDRSSRLRSDVQSLATRFQRVHPSGEIPKTAPVIVQVSPDLVRILNILSNWGELGRSTDELPVALEAQRLLANIRSVTGTSNRCTQADCSGCSAFQGGFRCHPESTGLPGQQTAKPQGECDVWALMHTANLHQEHLRFARTLKAWSDLLPRDQQP